MAVQILPPHLRLVSSQRLSREDGGDDDDDDNDDDDDDDDDENNSLDFEVRQAASTSASGSFDEILVSRE